MGDIKALHIGDGHPYAIATQVAVDLNKLIETRLLIQANSGGGKSYAIRWLLEQTYGKVQQIIIDREGEFSTLRSIHPYLLVGRDGDVAADIGTAKLLARKVLELSLSTVVDLSEMSPSQQRAYVRVFVDSLNHAPRQLWKDCLIVIDEAHIFAPESGKGASEATEAIALLLSTGRKRGFCPVLATQRLAKLNKDVAAECLNKLIGRTSNEDVKRAGEELAQGKQSSIQLRGLDPGTFWAYGPAIAPEPVLVRTGKVRTAPPARGAERTTPPAAPEEIRAALAKELAELPKQAADEAQTMVALQRQVADLSRELGIAKRAQGEPRVQYVQDQKAIDELHRYIENQKRLERTLVEAVLRDVEFASGQLTKAEARLREGAQPDWWRPLPPHPAVMPERLGVDLSPSAAPHHTRPVRDVELVPPSPVGNHLGRIMARVEHAYNELNGTDPLPRGAVRILETLAQRHPGTVTRGQLGKLAKFAIKGGTFNTYFNTLKRRKFVDERGGDIAITDAGLDHMGLAPPPMTKRQQWEHWQSALVAGENKLLAIVAQTSPQGIRRDELADVASMAASGGTFNNYLNSLRRNGLVTLVDGVVYLHDQWVGVA